MNVVNLGPLNQVLLTTITTKKFWLRWVSINVIFRTFRPSTLGGSRHLTHFPYWLGHFGGHIFLQTHPMTYLVCIDTIWLYLPPIPKNTSSFAVVLWIQVQTHPNIILLIHPCYMLSKYSSRIPIDLKKKGHPDLDSSYGLTQLPVSQTSYYLYIYIHSTCVYKQIYRHLPKKIENKSYWIF